MSQDEEIKRFFRGFDSNNKKLMVHVSAIINGAVNEFMQELRHNTPIGKPELWNYPAPPGYSPGQLRASWRQGKMATARSETSGKFIPNESVSKGHGIKLTMASSSDRLTIYNLQPYAERIEYGSWSTQAPQGMLRVTASQFNDILYKHIKDI